MRLLRNLSIARKLAVSSLATLGLLGVLGWCVLGALDQQLRLTDQVEAANTAERAGWSALVAVREMGIAERTMESVQLASEVDAALRQVSERGSDALRYLNKMSYGHAGPEAARRIQAAREALAGFEATLIHTARLRTDLMAVRDDGFLASVPAFEATMRKLREDAAHEGLLPNETEDLARQLAAYQDAVLKLRDGGVQFLITGYTGMDDIAGDTQSATAAIDREIAASTLSDPLKADAVTLAASAARLGEQARAMFDAARAVADYRESEVAGATLALAGRLDAAVAVFAGSAHDAQAASVASLATARRALLALGGGILLVLLASAVLTARAVARPIGAMTRAVQRMAAGDTAHAIGFAAAPTRWAAWRPRSTCCAPPCAAPTCRRRCWSSCRSAS